VPSSLSSKAISGSLKFSGKTVVVTGSGTGIGQAIAKKFAENGANVVILGRRKEPLVQTADILSEIMRKSGSAGRVRVFPGVDVADEHGISTMFEQIKKEFGSVDIIVNNAGVSGPVKTFTNATVNDFRDCVAIHLTGTFWTSISGLDAMQTGGRIITISTFFSEENRYEQRPYRFRTPYTAAQGAKNRLTEALAWELAQRGIVSVATNPGPVHSDRIYKTVYPKAAAEFLRIGGYPGLNSVEIEKAASLALPLLGESEETVSKGIREIATGIAKSHGQESHVEIDRLDKTIEGMLSKIQDIAEKIQNNTSKMIVDGQFLTQENVAEMVLNLSDDKIGNLVNGKVIPNDRVFYPVRPAVATSVGNSHIDLGNKVIIVTISNVSERYYQRINQTLTSLKEAGAKHILVVSGKQSSGQAFGWPTIQSADLLDENSMREIMLSAKAKFGSIDGVVHFTGEYDYNVPLSSLDRRRWDMLVENFIYIPALITKEAVNAMAPEGAIEDPAKYKGSQGIVVIVGPDAPVGKKISGMIRARADVFRGALRPYTTTVNQELGDVLGSNIRLFLVLSGNIEGTEPDARKLSSSVVSLLSGSASGRNETIFYIDESRPIS
jgi:NAD(P)-dependent dehydrogenase (short-subunit alcohol dehydrogenase family)